MPCDACHRDQSESERLLPGRLAFMSLIAASHAFLVSTLLLAGAVNLQLESCHERVADLLDGDLIRLRGSDASQRYRVLLSLMDRERCIDAWVLRTRRGDLELSQSAAGAQSFRSWVYRLFGHQLTRALPAEVLYGNRYLRGGGWSRNQVIWRVGWLPALAQPGPGRDRFWLSLSMLLASSWLLLALALGITYPPVSRRTDALNV